MTGISEAMRSMIEFHKTFGHARAKKPRIVNGDLGKLRVDLIREELEEYEEALAAEDLVEIADALGDLMYVVYGAALVHGIDLDAVFREIHQSNMSKLDESGKPVYRDDGKVLKSSLYRPPNLAPVLADQKELPLK